MKKSYVIYTVIFFALCLLPLVGMALPEREQSSENRTLADVPVLKDGEGWNLDYLAEAGDYFQDHFGFRQELVTANALVQGKLFGVSTAASVIQGTEGWLYYKDSLDDYLGMNQMSERALFNVAHSLAMMQAYVERQGAAFLFTIAPNKNSLYGEHMPYYDSQKVSEEKNLLRIKPWLEQEGVHYADLYQMFREQEEVLYHKRDSHWNNRGAAMAGDMLLDTLGKTHLTFTEAPSEWRTDFTGDLDGMLYPLATTAEEEIYYEGLDRFSYVGEVESNFDARINTVNPSAEGNLVMYRDSFGNTLLPFLANSYANAYFSRGIPYQMTDIAEHQADTVLVERAERFLPEMAENPPQMEAPLILPEGEILEGTAMVTGFQAVQQGNYVKVTGAIDEAFLEDDSRICIRVNGDAYEAFPATLTLEEKPSDGGFVLYLSSDKWQAGAEQIEILVQKGDKWHKIYTAVQ